VQRANSEEEVQLANHLTLDELGEFVGLGRKQVVRLCLEMSIPIYNGRVDKTLFVRSLSAAGYRLPELADAEAQELSAV